MKLAFDVDTMEIEEILQFLEIAKGYHFEVTEVGDKGLCLFVSKMVKE